MARIRDLGINAIPESRVGLRYGLNGLLAACPPPSQCPEASACHGNTCGDCTPTACACTDTGECGDCTDKTPPPVNKKKQALTHEAIAQLQFQLQQRIADRASLTI